jgi:hypothetical protein
MVMSESKRSLLKTGTVTAPGILIPGFMTARKQAKISADMAPVISLLMEIRDELKEIKIYIKRRS